MNRKVPVFLFALAGAVTVALTLLCREIGNSSGLRFITGATGILFPRGCVEVEVMDGGEFHMTAHLRLPMNEVEGFLTEYGFSDTTLAVEPWIGLLGPENREIPGNAELMCLEGEGEFNSWAFALDRSSGRLWIVVFYPDHGGSPP